ncbi:hypothetical protein ACJJTC_016811 [Scirpophaga incertulas]
MLINFLGKMKAFRYILKIFVLVAVICPLLEVISLVHEVDRDVHTGHYHKKERPCAVCPHQGQCVPRVQCPAHLRPGSGNPLCHLDRTDVIGVCCFTGRQHAAEADMKLRAASSISAEDMQFAHRQSKKKLKEWLDKSEHLTQHVILNTTTPSYGHHLSMATGDKRGEELAKGGLQNLFAAKVLKARQAISDGEIALGLTAHTDAPFCPPTPKCAKSSNTYRSFGGLCNNPLNSQWGSIHTGFGRLLPPDYSDGVWEMRASKYGLPLPSSRAVSNALLLDKSRLSSTHNLMFMQFGQFISHDVSNGATFTVGNGSAISCCTEKGEDFLPPEMQHDACAPIAVGSEDGFYRQFALQCLNFVRVQLAPALDCSLGYANQMNGVSHFLDLSHLYGSAEQKIIQLRAPGGLLKTFNDYGREFPPITEKKECLVTKDESACFESGDGNANQMISLALFHTLWTREHNRIAKALARLNSDWEDNRIYMEARRIVQAEYQHIVYDEWLPLLLGPSLIQAYGLYSAPGYGSSYDRHTDPSVTVEFSTSAMRFGHSIVDGKLKVPDLRTGDTYETIFIPEVMFQPARLRVKPFLDRLITGLTYQPMQSVDPFMTEGLTRYLFHGGHPFGIDLAAINIQRGRDFGVRSYNDYRRLIGLNPMMEFNEFSTMAAQRLASVYQTPEDIDLWVGGLLEEPLQGAVVGPTFAHILADQFSRLKRGDRYFYENGPNINPGAFTLGQLAEIKKVTFARILCDNKDGIELASLSTNAFVRSDLQGNEPAPCDSLMIQGMDLSRFKEI